MDLKKKALRSQQTQIGKLYCESLGNGLHLCYRRGIKESKWVGKLKRVGDGTRYDYATLGTTDWVPDRKNFIEVMPHEKARAAALEWRDKERGGEVKAGPETVAATFEAYLASREKAKGRKLPAAQYLSKRCIAPTPLGRTKLSELTQADIETWLESVEKGMAERMKKRKRKPIDDPETIERKRRASVNRYLTSLRACLNWAYKKEKIGNRSVWDRIEPYKNTSANKDRYLSVPQCLALIDACEPDFKLIVQSLLHSGCRYGEICLLKVGDFNPDNERLHLVMTKSGKPRHVRLTDEGTAFFKEQCKGRNPSEPMFTHMDGECKGKPWGPGHQEVRMKRACKKAGIEPRISIHGLRHTFASLLVLNNVPLQAVSELLGHSSTRMTQRYAHLSSDHLTEQLKANLPSFLPSSVPRKKAKAK